MNNHIEISTCIKCHHCIAVCPMKIIGRDEQNHASFLHEKLEYCIQCGQCMAVCESKAVRVEGLEYDREIFSLSENEVDFDKFYNFLSHRRSVRNFKNQTVPKETIQKLMDVLALAPYGFSPETLEITIITDRNIIETSLPYMSVFYDKMKSWLKNPFIRYMIKKEVGLSTLNTLKNHILPGVIRGHYKFSDKDDNITRHAPVLLIFHAPEGAEMQYEDGYILVTYAALAAHALGLGATMIGLVAPAVNKSDDLKKLFKIPQNHQAIISLIIGYPKFKYHHGIRHPRTKIHWLPQEN